MSHTSPLNNSPELTPAHWGLTLKADSYALVPSHHPHTHTHTHTIVDINHVIKAQRPKQNESDSSHLSLI